jgi:beta-xylosidase
MKQRFSLVWLWWVALLAPAEAAVPDAVKFDVAKSALTYTNSVGQPTVHMGDPLVLQHEGKYYLYGTIRSPEGGFRYFESSDLVHWQPKPGTAWKRVGGVQDVKFYEGKFYIVHSASVPGLKPEGPRECLAVSDRPEGPYRDLYTPWIETEFGAIDGMLFIDDDGAPYCYFSRNGNMPGFDLGGTLYAVALSPEDLKPIGKPLEIMTPDQPWEMILEHNHWCLEGPYVIKHNGKYYMTYSGNDTFRPGYAIGYAVADKPLGPWIKARENPILKDTPEAGIAGPGHNSITWSPDRKEMFIVYHSHADPHVITRDRVVNIDRLVIDENGRLKVIGPTSGPKPMPSGIKTRPD